MYKDIKKSEINMGGSSCDHYNSFGDRIGRSEKQAFDKWVHYDNFSNKMGHSICGTSHWYHYDNDGDEIGHSNIGFMGRFDHYDRSGDYKGNSVLEYGYKWNHEIKAY